MSFNTFGYNGVFEIRREIVNKLLANFYERNLVETGGGVSNDEFVEVDLGLQNGRHIVLYLRLGRPTASFDSAATTTNTVDLRVPVDVAVLVGTIGSGGGNKPQKNWEDHVLPDLGLGIQELALQEVNAGGRSVIRPDFGAVNPDQIRVYLMSGAPEPLSDDALDTLLKATLIPLTAEGLRTTIAAEVQGGLVGDVDVEIPSAGLGMAPLEQWDFQVLSEQSQVGAYDSLPVLLHGAQNRGRGIAGDTANTIPLIGTPAHSFALSIRESVLISYLDEMLDRGYFTQGGALNTPDNPYGYMVVSAQNQEITYSLPPPPDGAIGKVTISPPTGGNVTVIIPDGALSARSRAHLENLDTGSIVSFKASNTGGKTVTIGAQAGHRLSIAVKAMSRAQSPKTVVWRPSFSLHAGKIRMDFHYHHDIDNWCDAEGDGWAEFTLLPGRGHVFEVTHSLLDVKIDLPWWADVLGFLAGLLIGGLFFGLGGGLLGGFVGLILVEVIGTEIVSAFVADSIDNSLREQLKFPVPASGRLALFLERLEIHDTGLVLSGYADAGQIASYGRKELQLKNDLQSCDAGSGQQGVRFWFSPVAQGVRVTCHDFPATIQFPFDLLSSSSPTTLFWQTGQANALTRTYYTQEVHLAPGDSIALWVKRQTTEHAYTKVLLEWPLGSDQLRVSWVAYQPWVSPSVRIKSQVTRSRTHYEEEKEYAKSIPGVVEAIRYKDCYRYDGELTLEVLKHFRTKITREAGLEHWFLNGKEIPLNGHVTELGVLVTWDGQRDRIVFSVDQSPWVDNPGMINENSVIRFEGQDAFGTPMSAEMNFSWPACVVGERRKLLLERALDSFGGPEGLLPPAPGPKAPVRDLRDPLTQPAERLAVGGGNALGTQLAHVLATALHGGRADIDANTARLLIERLVGGS